MFHRRRPQHTVWKQGLGIITGDYDNAANGREAASTLVGNGADVI
jgi:basic membrane protein A and related proteins